MTSRLYSEAQVSVPRPTVLLKTTSTWSAAQEWSSGTFRGDLTVLGTCTGCGGAASGSSTSAAIVAVGTAAVPVQSQVFISTNNTPGASLFDLWVNTRTVFHVDGSTTIIGGTTVFITAPYVSIQSTSNSGVPLQIGVGGGGTLSAGINQASILVSQNSDMPGSAEASVELWQRASGSSSGLFLRPGSNSAGMGTLTNHDIGFYVNNVLFANLKAGTGRVNFFGGTAPGMSIGAGTPGDGRFVMTAGSMVVRGGGSAFSVGQSTGFNVSVQGSVNIGTSAQNGAILNINNNIGNSTRAFVIMSTNATNIYTMTPDSFSFTARLGTVTWARDGSIQDAAGFQILGTTCVGPAPAMGGISTMTVAIDSAAVFFNTVIYSSPIAGALGKGGDLAIMFNGDRKAKYSVTRTTGGAINGSMGVYTTSANATCIPIFGAVNPSSMTVRGIRITVYGNEQGAAKAGTYEAVAITTHSVGPVLVNGAFMWSDYDVPISSISVFMIRDNGLPSGGAHRVGSKMRVHGNKN